MIQLKQPLHLKNNLSLDLVGGSPDSVHSLSHNTDSSDTSDLSASERGFMMGESNHSPEEGSIHLSDLCGTSSGSDSPTPISPFGSDTKRKQSMRVHLERQPPRNSSRAGSFRDLLFSNSSHHSSGRKGDYFGGDGESPTSRNPSLRLGWVDEEAIDNEDASPEGSMNMDEILLPGRGGDDYDGFASEGVDFDDNNDASDESWRDVELQRSLSSWSFPQENRTASNSKKRGRGGADGGDCGDDMDFGAALSVIDTSGFFDALEVEYLGALEGEQALTKRKSSSVRFADESDVMGDTYPDNNRPAGVRSLAAIATTASDPFDLYDEVRDSADLMIDDDNLDDSIELDYDVHDDDDDEGSLYEDLAGDEYDSDEDTDDEKDEHKEIVRGLLYSSGAMVVMAGVGWAARKVMNAILLSRGDDDVGGVGITNSKSGAGAGHAAEVSANTANTVEASAHSAHAAHATGNSHAAGSGNSAAQ